ncbi:1481_t:CDS:1, partial [Cetraspora pellucida]
MAQQPSLQNQQPLQLPQNLNPMHNLANQIVNLVQQMQLAQPSQINLPATHRELNLVSYPEFSREDQDPISWLEDVEKAFEANQINDVWKIP